MLHKIQHARSGSVLYGACPGWLKKKTQATKCSDHRTISLISHSAKIIAKILRRRIERKIEDVLGEDQFGFRRGKGTRDAIGMMRIIAERTLELDEELCICFID